MHAIQVCLMPRKVATKILFIAMDPSECHYFLCELTLGNRIDIRERIGLFILSVLM
jgi:hypothetical protein